MIQSQKQNIFRDRDYIQDKSGNMYQILGSIHPKDSVFCLHKYAKISSTQEPDENFVTREEQLESNSDLTERNTYPISFWVQKGTEDIFIRVLPNYSSKSAHINIQTNQYRHFSSIFNRNMIQVPRNQIMNAFFPGDRLKQILDTFQLGSFAEKQNLDSIERQSLEVASTIAETWDISMENLGISGSILWNAHHNLSDIDMVAYGLSAVKHFFSRNKRLDPQKRGLRGFRKIELLPIAEKMVKRTQLPLEECFEYQYHKPQLLFHNDRRVSISFIPTIQELLKYPAYVLDSKFKPVCKIKIKARLKNDLYEYFFPGVLEIQTEQIFFMDIEQREWDIEPHLITRVIIFEQDFTGYYHVGDILEISGLLQIAENVPGFSNFDLETTYQVMVGAYETYGSEYIRVVDYLGND